MAQNTPAWRIVLWGSIPAILCVPAIAMIFTKEVAWGPGDFAAAAFLLVLCAAVTEIILRYARSATMKIVLIAILLGALALVWGELAVGIVGSPLAGT